MQIANMGARKYFPRGQRVLTFHGLILLVFHFCCQCNLPLLFLKHVDIASAGIVSKRSKDHEILTAGWPQDYF